jgi:hypothetical protein
LIAKYDNRGSTLCFVEALALMSRYRDHNDVVGNVEPDGEFTPPPQLAQYEAPIVETIPSVAYTVEEVMQAHHRNLFQPKRRPIASASFHSRSLSRF